MRWLNITSLAAILTMSACGGSAPVAAPSPTTAPPAVPSPAPSPVGRHIYGVVTDGDDASPIGGATIVAQYSTFPSAMTDGNGYFDVQASISTGVYPSNYLAIAKPGYDRTLGWVSGTRDERHDFRLYRPLNISAGASTVVSLTDDNSACGYDDEFRCRPVYVAIPSSGTLVMDTSADSTAAFWLLIGEFQYPFHGATHLEIPVAAGAVVTVQVLRDWSAPPGTATLRTALAN